MMGQRIGYVRVSSFDQNPERQLDGTQVDRTFTDKASGKDVNRPELEALTSFARTGDTVVVHSMDRLARNLDDLRVPTGPIGAYRLPRSIMPAWKPRMASAKTLRSGSRTRSTAS